MQVIVQLTPEVAAALKGNGASNEASSLRALLAEIGVSLRPQHPGVDDDALGRYFVTDANERDAGKLAERLSKAPGVTAAYAKPSAIPAR